MAPGTSYNKTRASTFYRPALCCHPLAHPDFLLAGILGTDASLIGILNSREYRLCVFPLNLASTFTTTSAVPRQLSFRSISRSRRTSPNTVLTNRANECTT